MRFSDERALAERALDQEQDRVDPESEFPPAADHLRAAREALGLSLPQVASRFGTDGHLCPDLELYDDELFTCIAVRDLLRLATVLETSAPALLFGEDPPAAIPRVTFSEIAESIRKHLSAANTTAEEWGEQVGWNVQPVLDDAGALGTYNVEGLRDICMALGIDWLAALIEHNRLDRPTKR